MLPEKKIHGRFDSHCGSVRSSMHDHTNSSPKGDRQHALIQQQVQSAEDEDKDEKKLRKSRLVRRFSVLKSTEQHHVADADDKTFYGVYGHLRKCLDYNYHVHYTKKRQWFHDAVVADSLFKDNDWSEVGPNTKIPTTSLWLILTVGIHGVYKHSVIHNLIASKKLPLTTFVRIDTADLRQYLPEYSIYLQASPEMVNDLTRKEAGYISETLTLAALHTGRNAIFFCSVKDCDWYRDKFLPQLRLQFPGLKVGLVHVTADKDSVLARSRRIARETGKLCEEGSIVETLDSIIASNVGILKSVVDYSCSIRNDGCELLLLDGGDWKIFADTFNQQIPVRSQQESVVDDCTTLACSDLCRRSLLAQRRLFSALQSSEENHKSDDTKFYGQFANIRATMDYSYHKNYTFERQMFQDAIINGILDEAILDNHNGEECTTPTIPWIVFTAGAFGAGKGYTLQHLAKNKRFPLMEFVRVNPDEIRRCFPEFYLYVQTSRDRAGELTNKEAGYIAEILTLAGLQAGKNVIVDGSLRRASWYCDYFARLRRDFPHLRIAIIHVTAPREAVFKHAAERAIETGRIVPRELLLETLEQVPRSVAELAPLVDYHVELRNAPGADIALVTPGENWEKFTSNWAQ